VPMPGSGRSPYPHHRKRVGPCCVKGQAKDLRPPMTSQKPCKASVHDTKQALGEDEGRPGQVWGRMEGDLARSGDSAGLVDFV
jgi:hypothetical protein